MGYQDSIVISNMIDIKKEIRYKAFATSIALHALALSALLFAVDFSHKRAAETRTPRYVKISLSSLVVKEHPLPLAKHSLLSQPITPKKGIIKPLHTKSQKRAHAKKRAAIEPLTPPANAPILEEKVQSPEAFTPLVTSEESPAFVTKPLHSPGSNSATQATKTPPLDDKEPTLAPSMLRAIRAMIQKNLVYPKLARKLRIEGVVVIFFVLDENGIVQSASVAQKSGSASLDTKALQTVLALSGEYPKLPTTTRLEIPVSFHLQKS